MVLLCHYSTGLSLLDLSVWFMVFPSSVVKLSIFVWGLVYKYGCVGTYHNNNDSHCNQLWKKKPFSPVNICVWVATSSQGGSTSDPSRTWVVNLHLDLCDSGAPDREVWPTTKLSFEERAFSGGRVGYYNTMSKYSVRVPTGKYFAKWSYSNPAQWDVLQ